MALALPALAHVNVNCRFSKNMLWILTGWRLDCAGLFHFRHDLPWHARGSPYGLVQPPRVLTRGQSQEQPCPNHTPNNDVEQTLDDAWETERIGVRAIEEIANGKPVEQGLFAIPGTPFRTTRVTFRCPEVSGEKPAAIGFPACGEPNSWGGLGGGLGAELRRYSAASASAGGTCRTGGTSTAAGRLTRYQPA